MFPVMKKPGAASQVSVARDKADKIAKPSSSMMQKVASALDPVGGAAGPDALDASAGAWGNAMQRMGRVEATNPLTAIAQVAGMGLAGYGQTKATQAKEAGSAAYKKRLADALAGNADSGTLMQLYNDPYADGASQRLAMNMWERQNPTPDELQQRQMRDLQMQSSQQQMELARQQAEQQAQAYQQQQDEYQRQQAIRSGKVDAVEGFMGQQEAAGGDLFSPEMQQALRQQGIQGADPADTRRYDAMQPYAQAGDYENAFAQMAAGSGKRGFNTLGEGQIAVDDQGNKIAEGPPKQREAREPTTLELYRAAQAQGYKGTLMDYQMDLKRAGASSTNVDLGGGSDKQVFDEMGRRYEAVQAASRGIVSLREAKQALMDGAITGQFADQYLALQKIGRFMGVTDPQKIVNTETFQSAIAPQVAAMIKATVGSTQISNTDRDFAMAAAGGKINLDEGTILRLVDIMERANTAMIDDYQARFDKVYPPNDTDPNTVRTRALYEVQDPAPTQNYLVLPQDEAQADAMFEQLPSGAIFQGPDGKVRRKP